MKPFIARLKKTTLRLIWVVVPFGCLYLLVANLGLIWTPDTCITDTIKKISNLSGYDFKIIETDCSTLGEDASVSIYASLVGQKRAALLFKYGPAGIDPYPSIAVTDQGNVSISVSVVSDVILQRFEWRSVSVDYHIGRVISPVVKGKTSE
jgi:hypothetical protein